MSGEITNLLAAWSDGDDEALDRLMPLVYKRLKALAGDFLRHERSDHTLHTMDLVHESFLRLAGQKRTQWQNQGHFFALAGQMMRRILVDHARRHRSAKWGGGALCSLDADFDACGEEPTMDLLALDEALVCLAKKSPELARMVELRYFVGLDREEVAKVLGISLATLGRRWLLARNWLYRYIVEGKRDEL